MQTVKMVLSEKALLKHHNKTVQLKDERCPALLFRYSTRAKGAGSFHCLLTANGKTTSKVIGPYPRISIEEARRVAMRLKLNQQADKFVNLRHQRFANLNELLQWYLHFRQQQNNTKAATLRNISFQINTLLIPYIGAWSCGDIKSGDLAEHWLLVVQGNFALSTVRGAFQCLKAALNQALQLGYLETNPTANIRFGDLTSVKVKPKSSCISRLQLRTLQVMIHALPVPQRTLSWLCLGFLTRNQETILAKWQDIDFKRGYWSIPAEHTKTSQALAHPLSPQMAELLRTYRHWQRRYIGRSEFLFPRKSLYKPITPSTACHQVQKASLGEFTLHDLRKYGSSYLRDMGADYYIVERILNHRKTQLDATYIHTTSQTIIRQWLTKWHTLLLG